MADAQPDPWADSIKSGTAPKPKAKQETNSWGSFRPGEAEPLPEDLTDRSRSGGGKKSWSEKKKAMPSGPNLPRKRVTPSKVVGQVMEWKGKYGWLMPMTPVHHPKAFKHQGKIFISTTDLDARCRNLVPGTICDFYVFEDEAGLGAEECAPVEPTHAAKGGKWGAQSGGSRPSKGKFEGAGRKGGGFKGSFGGKAGLSAPDPSLDGLTAADLASGRPSGRGAALGGAKGKGGRGGDQLRQGQKGSASKGSPKGGPAAPFENLRQLQQPRPGKGAGPPSGAVPQMSSVPYNQGAGAWDAFMSQRGQQLDQSAAGPPFMQSAFVDQSRMPDPFGQQPPLLPNFMDPAGSREPFFQGSAPDPTTLPDPMMAQSLFADPNRGMPPMVPYPRLDAQGWDGMNDANMQALMAASGAGSVVAPGYGYAPPGGGAPPSMPPGTALFGPMI